MFLFAYHNRLVMVLLGLLSDGKVKMLLKTGMAER